jgi:hypothetical protein
MYPWLRGCRPFAGDRPGNRCASARGLSIGQASAVIARHLYGGQGDAGGDQDDGGSAENGNELHRLPPFSGLSR